MTEDDWTKIIMAVLSVIGTVATLAAHTPNSAKSPILQAVLTVINLVGQNYGKAKNEEKPDGES